MVDSFGVTDSVGDADRSTLRVSKEIEPFKAQRVDDGLKVLYPAFKREILNVAIGESKASLIITDVRVLPGELADPGPPDRTLKIILHMSEPVSSLDKRGPRTYGGVCDPYTVWRGAKTDLIVQPCSSLLKTVQELAATWSVSKADHEQHGRNRQQCSVLKNLAVTTDQPLAILPYLCGVL